MRLAHLSLAFLAGLTLAAPAAQAQQVAGAPVTPAARASAKHRAQSAAVVLVGITLDSAQRVKARQQSERTRTAWSDIMRRQVRGTPMSAADRAALKQLVDAHTAANRAILTPAQRARYDANRAAAGIQPPAGGAK
jgi:hypothetical protein